MRRQERMASSRVFLIPETNQDVGNVSNIANTRNSVVDRLLCLGTTFHSKNVGELYSSLISRILLLSGFNNICYKV